MTKLTMQECEKIWIEAEKSRGQKELNNFEFPMKMETLESLINTIEELYKEVK